MLLLVVFLFYAVYTAVTCYTIFESVAPSQQCDPQYPGCLGPSVVCGDELDLELWLHAPGGGADDDDEEGGATTFRWEPVESCRFSFTVPKAGIGLPAHLTTNGTSCEVPSAITARTA